MKQQYLVRTMISELASFHLRALNWILSGKIKRSKNESSIDGGISSDESEVKVEVAPLMFKVNTTKFDKQECSKWKDDQEEEL